MFQMFPKIRFEQLCAHFHQGGLSIFDPERQQKALQLRWLLPLLDPVNSRWNSWVIPYLVFSIQTLCNQSDVLLPLLFPASRPGTLRSSLHALHLLSTASDSIPRNFNFCSINHTTCLALPLSAGSVPREDFPLPSPRYRQLTVGDAFYYDSHLHCIRRRRGSRLLKYPRLITRFHKAHSLGLITFSGFLSLCCVPDPESTSSLAPLDLQPFLAGLSLEGTPLHSLSSRQFRHLMTSARDPANSYLTLSADAWRISWTTLCLIGGVTYGTGHCTANSLAVLSSITSSQHILLPTCVLCAQPRG